MDTTQELLNRIRLGEDSLPELKEVRFIGGRLAAPHRDSLADELAAFANTAGGVCVLGVEDQSRTILGIPVDRLDLVEEFVRQVCHDSIEPALLPRIERLELPGATGQPAAVLKIEINRSLFVHQSPAGYLVRTGSSRRRMSPEYLARLFQQRSQTRLIRFDEQIVGGATLQDLDPGLWQRFQTTRTSDARPEDFLHKLGLAREDSDAVWRPTVAGILLASDSPTRWMPNAFIQAVAFRGVSPADAAPGNLYQLDAADLTGPLDRQVTEACRFVARNMRIAATKRLGRTDIPQFDLTAVFEAVVDAVAHRDYAIYGSKIRLRLYADRPELYSPGALANTMTVDSLPLRQAVRNELLTSLLARCPVPAQVPGLQTDRQAMMERRGEGVRLILDRTEALSRRSAAYRLIDGVELLLTLPAANPQEWLPDADPSLSLPPAL